jgi:hypothetical protein
MSAVRAACGALAASVLLTGCGGALTNSAWIAEPESGAVEADAHAALAQDGTVALTTSDSAPKGGPQRLDHTVTLGEVVATPRDPSAPVAAAPPSTSITINVNGYGAPAGYGYGVPIATGFSGTAARPSSAAPRSSGSSTVQPGQSWPAPASAGPSFPFNTSPASPWETKR